MKRRHESVEQEEGIVVKAATVTNPLLAQARCDICVEVLFERTVLACGHAQCHACVTKLHEQQDKTRITCPTCRAVHVTTTVPAPDLMFRDLLDHAIQQDGDAELQREWNARNNNNRRPKFVSRPFPGFAVDVLRL
jgi:hypothetical protein